MRLANVSRVTGLYGYVIFSFAQEVKSSREEQGNLKSLDHKLDSELAKLKSEFGQSHESVSLYCLMEHFKELSLTEDT